MARRTAFVWHELYMWHDTGTYAGVLPSGWGVLEPDRNTDNPAPKRRIKNLLDASGLTQTLVQRTPRAATREELTRVHTEAYVDAIERMGREGGGDARMDFPFGHTPFGPGGHEIAALAAGGAIAALDVVLGGEADNGYALVRPVGHHAEAAHGLGFCVYNNAAVAARHAQAAHGLGRVVILDWDVHHGNGAQNIFANDPSVLTISLHQDNCFPPGSGTLSEVGEGDGRHTNLNVPLPPGSGCGAYEHAMASVVVPAIERFGPDLILIASGYDACAMDPLGRMLLHSDAFRAMTHQMVDVAEALCGGRLVLTQEGGYSNAVTPFCALATIEALCGTRTAITDPFMDLMRHMGGQDLAPHQREAIDAAAALVADIPAAAR